MTERALCSIIITKLWGVAACFCAVFRKEGSFVMSNYSRKKSFWALMGAMILVVASTALFVYRYFEDKEYTEKWKDYDECGIQ